MILQNEVCNHEKLSQTLELQIMLTASTEVRVFTLSEMRMFTCDAELVYVMCVNQGLIAGKDILKVQSMAAAYVPTPAAVTSLWSSWKDGLFLSSSSVQQVEIKTDDDYAKVS